MDTASLVSKKQAALLAKHHAKARRKRHFIMFIFIVLIVGFFVLIRQPFLRVNEVKVHGSTLVSSLEVENYIQQEISGYKYFILPKNSIILIHKSDLKEKIMKAFPRLSEVSMNVGTRMNVAISEPIFESMYCLVSPDTGMPESCVLLHRDGKAGSVAPVYSYPPFFTFYSTAYQKPVLGSRILNTEEIDRVNGIRNELLAYDMPTYGIVYGAGQDEIILDTGEDFKTLPRIRIISGATKEDIHKTLGAAMGDPSISKLLENLSELSYIDLRFNGQVVYKRRGE